MQAERLRQFLDAPGPVASLRLTRVRGSSPRNTGTEMYVRAESLFGTIGGGQLEHLAIASARDLLAAGNLSHHMDVPLGPEIGQCCGGRVEIALTRMSPERSRGTRRGIACCLYPRRRPCGPRTCGSVPAHASAHGAD